MPTVTSTRSEGTRARWISELDAWSPSILGMARIMAGLLFLEHGLMKLLQFPAPDPVTTEQLPYLVLLAGVIETLGGALIAAGLFTRSAAFICSGEMAVAYYLCHGWKSFWPAINEGDAAILFCFFFLYLVFAGPGELIIQRRADKVISLIDHSENIVDLMRRRSGRHTVPK